MRLSSCKARKEEKKWCCCTTLPYAGAVGGADKRNGVKSQSKDKQGSVGSFQWRAREIPQADTTHGVLFPTQPHTHTHTHTHALTHLHDHQRCYNHPPNRIHSAHPKSPGLPNLILDPEPPTLTSFIAKLPLPPCSPTLLTKIHHTHTNNNKPSFLSLVAS